MSAGQISVLYCDDIRHEVAGKLSLIGVYADALLVHDFPVTLPKLCVFARLAAQSQDIPAFQALEVLKDGEVIHRIEPPKNQALKKTARQDTAEQQHRVSARTIQIAVTLSPVVFDDPCTLTTRALTSGGELSSPPLSVDRFDAFAASVGD